jgi:hypothetical protein
MSIKDLPEFKTFEKALKNLLFSINCDIITLNLDCKKTSNNVSIRITKEEKFNIKI